jgi:glutathione S-transferase
VVDSTAILHYLDELEPARELFRTPEIELFVDWFNRVWKVPPNAIEAERRAPTPDETRIAELGAELTASLDLFERLLDGRNYLFGGFSAADCAAFPFLKYALDRNEADDEAFHEILREYLILDGRARVEGWIVRVDALPRAGHLDVTQPGRRSGRSTRAG